MSTFASPWLLERDCNVDELRLLVERTTNSEDYPLAQEVASNALVYARADLPIAHNEGRDKVAAEWIKALQDGPGIIIIKGAFANSELQVIDDANKAFDGIIAKEKQAGDKKGDHFGKPGSNSRIWNALEKLAVFHPDVFICYYSNPILALVSNAWLGVGYQVTSQVNIVHPKGAAQSMHRDYHIGFQTNATGERYPGHAHEMSTMLTLQGAVAHCDMPLESGPTMYLPYSQKYRLGYLAWRQKEFQEYFAQHYVQWPLKKGDAVFFNPALFHAAGNNSSDHIHRIANLLQVSSPFGRAMETVNRTRVSLAIYPDLLKMIENQNWTEEMTHNAIAAAAEGYSFPTNLDHDQPVNGSASETPAQMMGRALSERWSLKRFKQEIQKHDVRRSSL